MTSVIGFFQRVAVTPSGMQDVAVDEVRRVAGQEHSRMTSLDVLHRRGHAHDQPAAEFSLRTSASVSSVMKYQDQTVDLMPYWPQSIAIPR
jgi:hypothetical protein